MNKAFSIVELLVAMAIFSLSVFTVTQFIADVNNTYVLNSNRITALSMLKGQINSFTILKSEDWVGLMSYTDKGNLYIQNTENSLAIRTGELIQDGVRIHTKVLNSSEVPADYNKLKLQVEVNWKSLFGLERGLTQEVYLTNWQLPRYVARDVDIQPGEYESEVIDLKSNVQLASFTWGSDVVLYDSQFQIMISDDPELTGIWQGPDLTSATYFSVGSSSLLNFPNARYFRYRVVNTGASPVKLNQISLVYEN